MNGRELARRVGGLRLFDDREDTLGALIDGRAGDDPVRRRLFLLHPDRPHHAAAAQALPSLDELPHGRCVADDDVVAPEHRERLRPDERARLQDGVGAPPGLRLGHDPHGRQALGPLQKGDVRLAELNGQTALKALVRTEVRVERFLPGRIHDDYSGDPRRGHLRDDELDDGRVDDRQEPLRDGPADRKKASPEPTGRDHAIPHRLEARRAVAHGRFSALTLKATGSVVRTANPVTATRARRSPGVSTSKLSSPLSTIRRSTVAGSPAKWRTWTAKRCETRFVERMKPEVVQPLSVSASSSGRPVISMSSTAKPPKFRFPSVTYWNRSWTCFPAYGARSAVRCFQPVAVSPLDDPVMPFPRFWPFGSVVDEASVRSGVQCEPLSVETST